MESTIILLVVLLVFFVIYLLICSIPAKMAKVRGRSYWGWFILALLNPVVIIVLVALMGDTEKRRLEKIREAEEIRLSVRAEYDKKNQERGM